MNVNDEAPTDTEMQDSEAGDMAGLPAVQEDPNSKIVVSNITTPDYMKVAGQPRSFRWNLLLR